MGIFETGASLSPARILTMAVVALALTGCMGSRLGSLDSRRAAPAPLTPAPTGTVTSGQLPPPAAPGTTDAADFPDAPQPTDQQMAAVDPAAAGAPDLEKSSLVGSWNVTSGGGSCQMFMTLTKYGNASRGGTRGCPGILADMKGWDVAGKQVLIYDGNGNTVARLYGSGGERYDGQTTAGQAVALSR